MTRVEGEKSLRQRVAEALGRMEANSVIDVKALSQKLGKPRADVARALILLPGLYDKDEDGIMRVVEGGFEPNLRYSNTVVSASRFKPNPDRGMQKSARLPRDL